LKHSPDWNTNKLQIKVFEAAKALGNGPATIQAEKTAGGWILRAGDKEVTTARGEVKIYRGLKALMNDVERIMGPFTMEIRQK